jgi:eukaryotic-like serine/threonine-protein kinase
MPAAPSRVQELFLRAIAESDLAARAALIDRECEPALRNRLNLLLKAHDSTEAVVDRPAVGNSTLLFNGAASPRFRTAQPGDMLAGRYRIIKQLGRGGMGVVFLAEQLDLHRHVALKMLTAGAFASPDELARFRGEAESLARLRHAGIVQVYDVGTHDGLPYLAMEHVAGGSLADSKRPIDPPVAARLVESLARAVQSAHGHGIVHRDLKPANVLLDDAQSPKITDFGLAKLLDQQTGLTRTGIVAGTPGYMSPEQASGSGAIGPAADIFALGAILYDLLTGRPPFQGATPHETVVQTCTHEPPALSTLRSGLPLDLSTICSKCLEKDPRRRYGSAGNLADDLGRFLRHEPIRARQVGNFERLLKWAKRRPAVAASLAAIVLVSVAAFVAVFAAFLNARTAQHNETVQRKAAERSADNETRQRQAAERSVYFGNIAQSRAQWLLNNIPASEAYLDKCAQELRGWEWHYLHGLHHSALLNMPMAFEHGGIMDLDINRNASRFVVAGGRPQGYRDASTILAFDMQGRSIWRRDFELCANNAKFTHDGRFVIYCTGVEEPGLVGELGVIDAVTGATVQKLELAKDVLPLAVAISPDGETFAAGFNNKTIAIYRTSDWQRLPYQIQANSLPKDLSFSADQRLFVSSDGLQCTDIWQLPDWKHRGQLHSGAKRTKFAPVGALLAEVVNSNVRIRDLSRWTDGEFSDVPIRNSFGHSALGIRNIAFSNDGNITATTGADGTVRTWNTVTGIERNIFRGHRGHVNCALFHPTGWILMTGGFGPSDVKAWDLTKPQDNALITMMPPNFREIEWLAFSEDDNQLVAFGWSGEIRAWDFKSRVATSRQKFLRPRSRIIGSPYVLSSDGRRAAIRSNESQATEVYDVADGRKLGVIPAGIFTAENVAMDRAGNRIAAGIGHHRDGVHRELRVWDVERQCLILEEAAKEPPFSSIVLSPDGSRLAYTLDRDILQPSPAAGVIFRVLDLNRSTQWDGPLQKVEVNAMAFSNDGRKLAIVDSRGAGTIFSMDTKQVEQTLTGPTDLRALAFSPDDTRLAGVNTELVHLWDVKSGSDILTLRGGPQRPSEVMFNPRVIWSHDGSKLAATNWDGTVSVWSGRSERR